MNYYNEIDPKAAKRLRSLISAGFIPPGHVDERSIADVRPSDLEGFTQCHFFAGIGGWSEALRIAGVSSDTRLWTGSCPCQPFSSAGRRKGTADERHLWPVFRDLIAQCQPPIVFGEQVASADGRDWLAVVRSEMEALGYAVGAADLCAAGIGAPHIRQRLWFVGERLDDTAGARHDGALDWAEGEARDEARLRLSGEAGELGRLGDTSLSAGERDSGSLPAPETGEHGARGAVDGSVSVGSQHAGPGVGGLVDTDLPGPQGRVGVPGRAGELVAGTGSLGIGLENHGGTGEADSFWGTADWLFCRDGKWRPVEPGSFPLAHGVPGRVAHLRGYGNAIVPQVAATFIKAALNL